MPIYYMLARLAEARGRKPALLGTISESLEDQSPSLRKTRNTSGTPSSLATCPKKLDWYQQWYPKPHVFSSSGPLPAIHFGRPWGAMSFAMRKR
jgi:hypothetical protein